MADKLKAFGLACFVAFVLSVATCASATAQFQFHTPSGTDSLTGKQIPEYPFSLTIAKDKITCKQWNFEGAVEAETSSTLTLQPTLGQCTYKEILGVHPTTAGCYYDVTLTSEAQHTEEFSLYKAPTSIQCEAGKSITLTVTYFGTSACTIHLFPQTPAKNELEIAELPPPASSLLVASAVSGLTYTTTSGSGICGSEGTFGNAAVHAFFALSAFSDVAHTKQVPITIG